MGVFLQIALSIVFIAACDSSIYSNVAGTPPQYLKSSLRNIKVTLEDENAGASKGSKERYHGDQPNVRIPPKFYGGDQPAIPVRNVKTPKTIIRIFKTGGEFRGSDKYYPRDGNLVKAPKVPFKTSKASDRKAKDEPYRLDAVLNSIRRTQNIARRRASKDDDKSDSESSSLELRDWKDEWKEVLVKKKLEALNQTVPQGDVVNMVAARPWGVPCGDPNQHDMPWGTCMVAMECEPEYRIYRGDFQCGRTKFVCCSIQLTNYDMYQGFDASFADTDLSTDSEEQRNQGKGSSERRRKKKERKRRRKVRQKRKEKIKKNITKIIKEIRKILNKQYRNGTIERKRKTKQLKKFIKDLKKKYKKDRKSVKNIHEVNLVKIDSNLVNKLKEIRHMNEKFVTNSTFREIIVNGTINRKGARMLVEAYPELLPYFTDKTRRTGDGDDQQTPKKLEYDVEYGMLYY